MPEVHPANELVWDIFLTYFQSQPIVGGMGDFHGFNLSLFPVVMQGQAIPQSEWDFILRGLSIISSSAVATIAASVKRRSEKGR